jgi:hypothetical protein
LKANDKLNKEQEEEHTEKEIKPRGSKKIMCSGIIRRVRMTKQNLKNTEMFFYIFC